MSGCLPNTTAQPTAEGSSRRRGEQAGTYPQYSCARTSHTARHLAGKPNFLLCEGAWLRMAKMHNEQNTTVTVNVTPTGVPARLPLKTVGAAAALAIFLGGFGAHRFYLNRPHAPVMLGIGLVGSMLWVATVVPLQMISVVWALIDLASIRAWVAEANAELLSGPAPTAVTETDSKPAALPAKPETTKPKSGTLETRLLRAAEERGGKITVTQGVMDTSAGFDEVRECLREMVEQGYADVGNASDSGVVVYTFDEL